MPKPTPKPSASSLSTWENDGGSNFNNTRKRITDMKSQASKSTKKKSSIDKSDNFGSNSKAFIHSKTFEEVEGMASDAIRDFGSKVSDVASRSAKLIRKNPVMIVAAVVTLGLVISKMMGKPQHRPDSAEKKGSL